ncbi:MAG: ATP-binding protein [Rhodospirillaceae bacterium]|nr:ATP-binding protein [Rhodospirillaceae bacterium]
MSLRVQLLGLGLLTLALPWAGYRYVQQLEGALRSGLEQSLLASARTVASALGGQELGLSATNPTAVDNPIYAHPLSVEPLLDGYRDDWDTPQAASVAVGASGRLWLGLYDRTLYLFGLFADRTPVYQSAPGETPYGDRVLLLTEGEGPRWLLLHTAAPGALRAQRTVPPRFAPSGDYETRVLGFWRETPAGFAVEARLPLQLAGERLGVSVVDVSPDAGTAAAYRVAVESSWSDGEAPAMLLYRPTGLSAVAGAFEQPGRRLRVVDVDGWVLYDGGAIDPLAETPGDAELALAERFYRLILRRNDPPYGDLERPPGRLADAALRAALGGDAVTAWYARGPEASAVVAAAVPIADGAAPVGALILEQGSDSILTLTNAALVRLMSVTLLATSVVTVGLLGYATLLSFRVRRLARAADSALGPKGEIRPALPGRGARDEIGDLARSFTHLLDRLREYTDYLSTLKGKLAHELRTPLAVVSTSLDNLEREPHGSNLSPYLGRLREGVGRLDAILNAMSEATLIEQAISSTEPEVFDVHPVLQSCTEAYRDVFRDRRFTYERRAPRTTILGSAELVAQMMDKLIDNAVSFSPAHSTIEVRLTGTQRALCIAVINRGPGLPKAMRAQLFDSLVSVREAGDGRRHLGLGLYIVSLVADFHRGRTRADDLADASGVIFEVSIPVAGSG